MAEKINGEFYSPGAAAFNYNMTGGTDSASGGSGGSGMDCLQLRSPPEPFHYLISEQAKSLVALQELQNEVGALLEFRDLVIETFPNLRSKMAPSTPTGGPRRDWEPGVRVRRKLANGSGDSARTKPQPSVQDSGFSTETSCGKDAHSATRRPVEDELWALLDVIQRKGGKLRDEAEVLRGELDGRHSPTSEHAEESFVRALDNNNLQCECADVRRLRKERDELLVRSAQLEAHLATKAAASLLSPQPAAHSSPALGHLDAVLGTPPRPPRTPAPNSARFAAILRESNPVELQRHLLTSSVNTEILSERLRRVKCQHAALLDRLERTREENDDLKFQLEEKTIELEGTKAKMRLLDNKKSTEDTSEDTSRSRERERDSMKDLEPFNIPDEEKISETPRRSRPSRIPLHTAVHKGIAPKPPAGAARDSVPYRSRNSDSPARPPSSHSCRSVASAKSRRNSYVAGKSISGTPAKTSTPVKKAGGTHVSRVSQKVPLVPPVRRESLNFVTSRSPEDCTDLIVEYLARTDRLPHMYSRLPVTPLPTPVTTDFKLAYERPQNLALELSKSILYESSDFKTLQTSQDDSKSSGSLWNGKPQQYFESMNFGSLTDVTESIHD